MKLPLGKLIMLSLCVATPGTAPAQTGAEVVPPGFVLKPEGVVNGAVITGVLIRTNSEIGPYTAFRIIPPQNGASPEWFYVRNDTNVKAMERGAIIGLLMGAAQATFSNLSMPVSIKYHSIGNRKEIEAVSLGGSFRE